GILLNQLKDIPISVSSGYYEEFRQCCAQAGFTPRLRSINTTRNTTLHWASADMAVTVVPLSEGEDLEENLIVKKILDADAEIYKSVVKVKGRPLSLLALKFLEFYNEYGYAKRLCNIQSLYEESKKR
ncbi:MAG: LysR family transcriptional regulator substrate-binding protein, partial [Acidaminococcaceae bacterium]|nr:LysR family transcriptional regulator substrate-binding protein [Acidaminococcaceae bacterium]